MWAYGSHSLALSMFFTCMFAPASNNSCTVSVLPQYEALMRDVSPS